VRLDFLALSPGDALRKDEPAAAKAKRAQDPIQVPREVLFHYPAESGESQESARPDVEIAPAWVPMNYVIEPQQRIEIYRKLAQADGVEALAALQRELRDRFGPVPDAVELLLKATGLKILAGQKDVSSIETKGDKLMLTRHHDFIMAGGKFPRLTKRTATARLNEIKRLLLAL